LMSHQSLSTRQNNIVTSSKCLSGLSPDALCRFNLYLMTKLNIR
jgi:hypothetical protein